MKEQFRRFLVKNKAFRKFCINLKKQSYPPFNEYFDQTEYKSGLITYSFNWTDSPEGNKYWGALSLKWQKELK